MWPSQKVPPGRRKKTRGGDTDSACAQCTATDGEPNLYNCSKAGTATEESGTMPQPWEWRRSMQQANRTNAATPNPDGRMAREGDNSPLCTLTSATTMWQRSVSQQQWPLKREAEGSGATVNARSHCTHSGQPKPNKTTNNGYRKCAQNIANHARVTLDDPAALCVRRRPPRG